MTDEKLKTPRGVHLGNLREHYDWKKVVAPKTWRPKLVGDEIIGFFGGKTVRNGHYGQYECVIVHVPSRGSYMLTGVQIVNLVDASGIDVGWPVRIVWGGYLDLTEGKKMKQFEVFVAEGDPIAETDLPQIKGQGQPPENMI